MTPSPIERRLSCYLQLVIILLGLATVRVWMLPGDILPQAHAQLPDSAAQRLQLIREAERTNALLAEILATLREPLVVKIQEPAPDK